MPTCHDDGPPRSRSACRNSSSATIEALTSGGQSRRLPEPVKTSKRRTPLIPASPNYIVIEPAHLKNQGADTRRSASPAQGRLRTSLTFGRDWVAVVRSLIRAVFIVGVLAIDAGVLLARDLNPRRTNRLSAGMAELREPAIPCRKMVLRTRSRRTDPSDQCARIASVSKANVWMHGMVRGGIPPIPAPAGYTIDFRTGSDSHLVQDAGKNLFAERCQTNGAIDLTRVGGRAAYQTAFEQGRDLARGRCV